MVQLADLKGAVIVLAMIALIAGALAITLAAFKDDWAGQQTLTSVSNESIVYTNATATSLANNGQSRLSCTAVRDINGTTISSGNYTCAVGSGITITNEGGWTDGSNTTVYVDYSYLNGDYMWNITGNGEQGIGNTTSFLATIGTILGVMVLVGIVVTAFMFGRQ